MWWRNPLPITLCYSFGEVEYIRCFTPRSVSGQDQSINLSADQEKMLIIRRELDQQNQENKRKREQSNQFIHPILLLFTCVIRIFSNNRRYNEMLFSTGR